MNDSNEEKRLQQEFFSQQAAAYDETHDPTLDVNFFALEYLAGALRFFDCRSVLDIGSGTGRKVAMLKERVPGLRALGVEPVAALREAGYKAGLARDELADGDVLNLPYPDGSFDIVCEFAVLHHVRHPARALAEMIRVAKRGIFISDSNNFGSGSALLRSAKQLFNACGLWPVIDFVKTNGKGYTISLGDGVAYSFSPYTHWDLIHDSCPRIYTLNSDPAGMNPYRSSAHVAMLAMK